MKLHECKDWKAVHFGNMTILKSDCKYLSAVQKRDLQELEVEPIKGREGHYRVK